MAYFPLFFRVDVFNNSCYNFLKADGDFGDIGADIILSALFPLTFPSYVDL